MYQLAAMPQNPVLSEEDMRIINSTCRVFGGVDNREPLLEESKDGAILLDFHFGYHFWVRREERTVTRTMKSLKGDSTTEVQANGFLATMMGGEGTPIFQSWSEDVKGLLVSVLSYIIQDTCEYVSARESLNTAKRDSILGL